MFSDLKKLRLALSLEQIEKLGRLSFGKIKQQKGNAKVWFRWLRDRREKPGRKEVRLTEDLQRIARPEARRAAPKCHRLIVEKFQM